MSKVLVVGGTGNIGRELVPMLLEKDSIVRTTYRDAEKLNVETWAAKTENFEFDYKNRDKYPSILGGVDKVFMVAPPQSQVAHVLMTPFIDACLQAGVQHVVFSSAMGVEHDSSLPLRVVELYLIDSGLNYTILRPNWFMQNFNSTFLHSIRRYGKISIPAGDSVTSFIDTRDIAEVAVEVFEYKGHQGEEYVLTGREAINHFKVAEILSAATGKEITYIPQTEYEFRKMMIQMGTPEPAVRYLLRLYKVMREGYTAPVSEDVQRILGRHARTFDNYAGDYAHLMM